MPKRPAAIKTAEEERERKSGIVLSAEGRKGGKEDSSIFMVMRVREEGSEVEMVKVRKSPSCTAVTVTAAAAVHNFYYFFFFVSQSLARSPFASPPFLLRTMSPVGAYQSRNFCTRIKFTLKLSHHEYGPGYGPTLHAFEIPLS